MPISFSGISVGSTYSRPQLAELWGYNGWQAIARGVVTPQDDNKIVLFVTHEKQKSAEQYEDHIAEGRLYWEGPTDHFAEDRMRYCFVPANRVITIPTERRADECTEFSCTNL